MKEYIEREEAIQEILRGTEQLPDDLVSIGKKYAIDVAVFRLENTLAADVVEVVRCGNCKKSWLWKNVFGNEGLNCDFLDVYVSPNDYCSYGERKE